MASILTKILGKTKRVKKKAPVWETYDGQIADMRRQGHTLQAISDKVGVTRERVRQILAKHYGEIKTNLVPEVKLARIIGCPVTRLRKLRISGVINPVRYECSYLYDRNEIEKAMLALQRNCEHCGVLLPMKNVGKRCPECKKEYKRYAYPFLSDEAKKRANKAAIKWQKQHPEQYKEAQQRAEKTYWEKKKREHYAKTRYVVVGGEVMPIGSIFKAEKCQNHCLVLKNGLRISVSSVRKIK